MEILIKKINKTKMKKFLAIAIVVAALVSCNEKKTDETTVVTDTTTVVPMTAPTVDTTAAMMDTTKMMPTDTTAPKM